MIDNVVFHGGFSTLFKGEGEYSEIVVCHKHICELFCYLRQSQS